MPPELLIVMIVTTVVILAGIAAMLRAFYVSVPSDKALLVADANGNTRVFRTGRLVLPFVSRAELVNLRTTTLELGGGARGGFRCRDRIRVTLKARFLVAVNPTAEDAARAAQQVGAPRLADQDALLQLFEGKFEAAIATVVAKMSYEQVSEEREHLQDHILSLIGQDLDGFVLRDVAIGEILQVPVENLDPDDVLDAEAIRKITERTAQENARTNELRRETRKATAEQDIAAAEELLRIEAMKK